MSDDRHAGRWATAACAVVLAGGGFAGAGGLAYAGDDPDNVGAPGGDGQDVTCTAYAPPANVQFCNSVGEDGADGKPGTATANCREVPPPEDGVTRCTARPGAPGAGGQAVGH